MLITKTVMYRGKETPYEKLKPRSVIPLVVKCDACGAEFVTTKYQLLRNGHELCQSCALRSKFEKPLPIGSQFGRLTVIGVGKRGGYSICRCSCENKTEKEVANDCLLRGRTLSCGCLRSENGAKQASEYLSKFQRGESHPNWKGGISPIRNRVEKTSEYKGFRSGVFARDGFKCVVCGTTKNLKIHHLQNFADNPELRTSLDNGVCICENCHRAFHSKYGLKNTTAEQFSEFCKSR